MTPSLDRAPRHRPAARELSAVIDHVIVVLPAHDERSRIGDTIASIHRARTMIDARARSMLVVVADTCSDDTAALARQLCGAGDLVLETTDRSVGTARRKGTHAGLKRTNVKASNVWLANTDADSVVPDDWLTAQLDLARDGVVGVAGVVGLRDDEHADDRLRRRFDDAYLFTEDGGHHHVHGANLGVRADAYLAAGGWSDLETGEDHDLWRRLSSGGPLVSSTAIRVATSPRSVGRAPAGFAVGLTELVNRVGVA